MTKETLEKKLNKIDRDSNINKLGGVLEDILERRDYPVEGGVYLYRGDPVIVLSLFDDLVTSSGDYGGGPLIVNCEVARVPSKFKPETGQIMHHPETSLVDTKDLEEYIDGAD